jgi:hypothetical protein
LWDESSDKAGSVDLAIRPGPGENGKIVQAEACIAG